MGRNYKKRTKSTSAKTYKDYLTERKKLIDKGYYLHDAMSETSFNEFYNIVREARRTGEIKSSSWQYLISKERYISYKQAKVFAQAASEMEGKKVTRQQALKFDRDKINELGKYIAATKETGLYGGDYE